MIEAPVFQDTTPLDVTANVPDEYAQRQLDQAENRVAVGQLLEILPTDEYHAIKLTIGEARMTLREAGEELGVSHETVRALQQSALRRMRHCLAVS